MEPSTYYGRVVGVMEESKFTLTIRDRGDQLVAVTAGGRDRME
jgi:hypothetical protein